MEISITVSCLKADRIYQMVALHITFVFPQVILKTSTGIATVSLIYKIFYFDCGASRKCSVKN
ncbi:hypothetical protein BH11BAC5_BH11BAC5_54510 [soil metagenome]